MRRQFLVGAIALAACQSHESNKAEPSKAEPSKAPSKTATANAGDPTALRSKAIAESERAAAKEDAARTSSAGACAGRTVVINQAVRVAATGYFLDGGGERPIPDLDRPLSTAQKVTFTLKYPFEKPFAGVVTAPVTLRRTIDAIRDGFRQMYEGATVRDIPNLYNKDVTGPYGHAFHAISDLVVDEIDRCADDSLMIFVIS